MTTQPIKRPGSTWSTLVGFCLSLVLIPTLYPTTASAQSNPIVIENQQPGNSGWDIDNGHVGTDTVGQIKGYGSAITINKGDSIDFHVSVNPAQTYTIDVYRIGWYQGLGGRLMQHIGPLSGTTQPACPVDVTTGLIECQWTTAYTLQTQTSWTTGVYLAVLTNSQNFLNYIIFVVRDDASTAPLLYQVPVTGHQAYNDYPNNSQTGKSLYDFNSYGAKTVGGTKGAVKVSFDRPYADDGSGGDFRSWEVNFIRWMERTGYNVTYSTNIDTHTNGGRLLSFRGFLDVGHDEYVSKPMYDALNAARDAGVNLGFFTADAVYTQIRLESSSTGVPNRVMVCYRDPSLDPNPDPTLKTVNWRDPPLNLPEQVLVGVQFTSLVPYNNGFANYVVTNSSNWVYAGTGFKDGDSVKGIVGYEADRSFTTYPQPNAVPGTYTLLSHSSYSGDYSNSSVYQAPSGAWVFGSGSMDWNWALDSYNNGFNLVDARIQQTTANILNRFINTQADFTLTATPASQTVIQGFQTNYTVTVGPLAGFNGQVTLSVAGLPTGATGTFTPNPATATSTLAVTTAATTPAGTYTLTITGISGPLTHTTTTTLVVTPPPPPDFSLSATPPTQTVVRGNSTNFGVTITPISGFSGQITLSVAGLPTGAAGTFTPNPATASSTLNITTAATTPTGSYTVTITGVSGSLTHTATATLTVASSGVTFDNKVSSDIQFGVTSITTPAFVIGSGANRAAMIMVAMSAKTATNITATLGGVAGTLIPGTDTGTTASVRTMIFQVINPPSGSQTAKVSWTTSMNADVGVITVTGADQITPCINGVNSAASSSPSATTSLTIVSNVGDLTASIGYTANQWQSPFTNQTLKWGIDSGEAGGDVGPGLGNTTHSWTDQFAFQPHAVSGANFKAASGLPDFSLSGSPASQTVAQGGSTTYGITVNPIAGFSGQVSLSVAGLPFDATGTFTPNPATASSTLAVTTAADTPTGTYTLTLTGVNGSLTHTATVTLVVNPPPDFSLSGTPASQTVVQGGSTSYGVTITPVGGFSGQVTLSASGLPTGATGSFTTNPATASSTLNVTTTASVPTGSYTVTITGVSGSLTHTATVTLVINPLIDFTVSGAPASQTVVQGGSTSYGVTITPLGGFSGQVTLSASGLPTGATGSFTTNPATTSSSLSVTTLATTPAGSYTLTITGVSGSLTHTATVTLVVNVPPDYSLSGSPASQTVAQGVSTSYGVTITPVGGFSSQVSLSVSGLPFDATGSFTTNPATTSSSLSVTTAADTPTGTYTLTITGTSGSLSHTATVTLVVTVPPDFSIAGSPSSQTVIRGSNTTYGITITPSASFTNSVTLSVAGLPAGATGAFAPNPATTTSTLTVTTSSTTPAGSYTLTLTGVGGGLTRTTTVTLVVNLPPDFSLSGSPSSQSVIHGGSTSYGITITPSGGFSGQVTLSVAGLPTGATGSFDTNPATTSSSLSVTTATTTPAGSYTLTITGVSGSLTHTATVTLVVSVPPDFSLSGSPASQTVVQGKSINYTVTITPVGGFAGQVTLSVAGLPTGATPTFSVNPATTTSTLSVATLATTPTGSYTLTITGVNGALTHTATVSLTVAHPGVIYDSKVSSGIKFGVTTITTPAIVIGTGSNRAAMIMVAMGANTATNITASLGGVAATLVPGTDTGTAAAIRTMIFQVINPPSGSKTATVSWTTSMNADVGVIAVSGADQTTPCINGSNTAVASASTAATSLTITSNFGDLTATIGYSANKWKSPYTNQTLKWGIDSTSIGGDVGPGTGTTTHTWTDQFSFQTHAVSGANFKAAP